MKRLFFSLGLGLLFLVTPVSAAKAHVWEVGSPDHQQTFTFGTEQHRAWMQKGDHLSIVMKFTNDPYVDQTNPRLYDDFIFNFPNVTLGKDGRTFYYQAPGGRAVAVAFRRPGLFGDEVTLLPSSFLAVQKPHGLLSLTLVVTDHAPATASN